MIVTPYKVLYLVLILAIGHSRHSVFVRTEKPDMDLHSVEDQLEDEDLDDIVEDEDFNDQF